MDYKPDYADPNDYRRMSISRKNKLAIEQGQFEAYLRKYGILNRQQLAKAMTRMTQAAKNRESSFLQKIGSWIWYAIKPELTPKRLAWLLANTDKVVPFVANNTLKEILIWVDRLADVVYRNMDD